jgi:hypothetical protein
MTCLKLRYILLGHTPRYFFMVGRRIGTLPDQQKVSLDKLYNAMKDMPCATGQPTAIKDYALISIAGVEGAKINKAGSYELAPDRSHTIDLSFYQGDSYRERKIIIGAREFSGISDICRMTVAPIAKGQKDTIILAQIPSIAASYEIPLCVCEKRNWFKSWLADVIVLLAISAIVFFAVPYVVSDPEMKIRIPLLSTIIILLVSKGYENWSRRS